MDNKTKLLRRLIALFVVLVTGCGVAVYALFNLQIINGEKYAVQSQRKLTSSLTVTASRGEILDRYGRPLVTNKNVFSLRIDYAYWDKTAQNATILELAALVRADGATVEDELPITASAPFAYTVDGEDAARKKLEEYCDGDKNLKTGLDAPAMMAQLREKYKVDASYSDEDARTIVGVRYQMARTGFSLFNSYIFAHDISIDLISKVKERHKEFVGVDIETEPVREYKTTYAAHILGRVGPMYKEEWNGQNGETGYKDIPGYAMNSQLGKDGMEKALEEYLHGTNGARSVETNITGKVTSEVSSSAPQPGDNCILTLDLTLQMATEDALAKRIRELPDATSGAAVVIEVGTGEVLAMASYPTYNLETFSKDYNTLKENPAKPMINRAISGLYAPGSTYKPLTAIAGLEESVISMSTRYTCNHTMRYLNQPFNCMGYHGSLDVVRAIQKSCNIYFYNTGIALGGDKLEDWARQFGFGQKTGIELAGESRGYVAGPTNRASMVENDPSLRSWGGGDNLLAAIGQGDNAFTPIQLANYTATLASEGKHYRARMLKSVKTYDYSETVVEDIPELLGTVEMSESTRAAVKSGMGAVVSEGGTAASVFGNYPIKLAGKSGTSQVYGQKIDNGVFIAYAPYDDPQIAIAVVIEKGKSGTNTAPVVRDILDAYFASEGASDNVAREYTLIR